MLPHDLEKRAQELRTRHPFTRESDITGFDSAELIDMTRPCDLCGETDSLDTPGDPSGKIRICKGCGFVHVKERRSLAEVAQAWTHIYRSGGYDPEWPGVKARLFYVAEWLDQTIGLRGKSVLDIGAGNGQFLAYCRDRGADPWGLDPDSDNCIKIDKRGFPFIHSYAADDGEIVFPNSDIVTLNWTLENTADCLAVLRYAKRCLAPGGHVVVSTGSRFEGYKKPLSSYLPQDPDYPHDTHCFRWSFLSLMTAGRNCGLYAQKWNDYKERDELIMTFNEEPDERTIVESPQAVLMRFTNWRICNP